MSKIWLVDPATNTYGGVYLFADAASREDYLDSELVSGLLLRPQAQERERYVKHLGRLHELGSGVATGPGWRSPA